MKKWGYFFLVGLTSCLLDLNSKSNVVIYWGQNSYGGAHPDQLNLYEKSLRDFCDDPHIDVINLGFLIKYNTENDGLPKVNFSKHCSLDPKQNANRYKCPEIGKDIEYCQNVKQKTILLSLGGEGAHLQFGSPYEATRFATKLWNIFMGGTHQFRPFGNVIIDGIDLDIEHGSQMYYEHFLTKLQEHYKSTNKKYFVTAAPQCVFPDRNVGEIMNKGYIDAAFIQFYNNQCGLDKGKAFNWNTWSNWAKQTSFNKEIKLFLGLPASSTAASSGYISPQEVNNIIDNISKDTSFGGVSVWDASHNMNNKTKGKTFTDHIKNQFKHLNLINPASQKLVSQSTSFAITINGNTMSLICFMVSILQFIYFIF